MAYRVHPVFWSPPIFTYTNLFKVFFYSDTSALNCEVCQGVNVGDSWIMDDNCGSAKCEDGEDVCFTLEASITANLLKLQ